MKRLGRAALIFAVVVLAGCGGSSHSSDTASSPTSQDAARGSASATSRPSGPKRPSLQLAADPRGRLRFSRRSLTSKAGQLTIHFVNHSRLMHNLTVSSSRSGTVLAATPTFQGHTQTLVLNLTPGTYVYYCSVPGHRSVGMQGILVVG